jgi:hypothetical protein
MLLDQRQGLLAVSRFKDNGLRIQLLERAAHSLADQLMVVHHQKFHGTGLTLG